MILPVSCCCFSILFMFLVSNLCFYIISRFILSVLLIFSVSSSSSVPNWCSLFLVIICHNPTNNPKQNNLGGVVLLSLNKKPHYHLRHPTHTTRRLWLHFKPLPDNLVCNHILTQLKEIWKTTSIFKKIKDKLNLFENGRRPNFFCK